jgi:hypothetical protein
MARVEIRLLILPQRVNFKADYSPSILAIAACFITAIEPDTLSEAAWSL